jgi:hypothetical protein
MPINVNYTPVGALGQLAYGAGQGQAYQAQAGRNVQMAGINAQAQAEAFRLQTAMATRLRDMQQVPKTPAADHVAERIDFERAETQRHQTDSKQQLDTMLAMGAIDQDQYQQAMLGVVSGNQNLMAAAFRPNPTEKPNISSAAELDMIREPFREKRRMLAADLSKLRTDVIASRMPAVQQQIATMQKQLDDSFATEQAEVAKYRQRGSAMYSGGEQQVEQPGTMSMVPVGTAQEEGIMAMARQLPSTTYPGVTTQAPISYGGGGGGQPANVAPEGMTIMNPQTGQRLRKVNGQWTPIQ